MSQSQDADNSEHLEMGIPIYYYLFNNFLLNTYLYAKHFAKHWKNSGEQEIVPTSGQLHKISNSI